MDINAAFPSKFLKAADLKGRRVTVVISEVSMREVGDNENEEKPVCYFEGKTKGLVLNKTNASMIAEICDDSWETDDWVGASIILFATKVDFQGRRVDALRVDSPKSNSREAKKTAKEMIDEKDFADVKEDLPF